MRFAAYAGTSTVLAIGVVIRALHERANFYSACVYLAQSNACLMVLTNIALLGVCTGMLGFQKLFYGPLRPIEVEQLYEKAWFAITETCLAMTIFREEVGGWFLVMFVCLLTGKVWGWIGEGRVEILEQQPPSNPRLFHARLSVSLIVSVLFDLFMLRYSINTVLRYARPSMMVMFAFEFAVLAIMSFSTAARYTISVHEASIIKNQIRNRRARIRQQRDLARSRTDATDSSTHQGNRQDDLGTEDDVESIDIDVPGWEEKGRWIFYLDLFTDLFKLILYLTFFCVLCMFYGMPIHIIRDVALTIRSFYKRIADFTRYRQATRDMNARYPDATSEEVAREDVCIICREDMRAWQQQDTRDHRGDDDADANGANLDSINERLRPKKLPCGHILHFACLRSWLERQQNCPICRRPVLATRTVAHTREQGLINANGRERVHRNHPQAYVPVHGNPQQPVAAQNVFTLGPLRIAFGAGQRLPRPLQPNDQTPPPPEQPAPTSSAGPTPRMNGASGPQHQLPGLSSRTIANLSAISVQSQLLEMEHHLLREINALRLQQDQLHLVRALQGELTRLRAVQPSLDPFGSGIPPLTSHLRTSEGIPHNAQSGQSFVSSPQQQVIGHTHPNLPAGLVIPPGWTVMPLQRLSNESVANLTERSRPDASRSRMQAQSNTQLTESLLNNAGSFQLNDNSNSESLSGQPGSEAGQEAVSDGILNSAPSSSKRIATSDQDKHLATGRLSQQGRNDESQYGVRPRPEVSNWAPGIHSRETGQKVPEGVKNSKLGTPPIDDTSDNDIDLSPHSINRTVKGKGKATTIEDLPDDGG